MQQKKDKMLPFISTLRFRIIVGAVLIGVWVFLQTPQLFQPNWGRLLVLIAPLVIIPIALSAISKSNLIPSSSLFKRIQKSILLGSLPLFCAYSMEQGLWAGICSLPWLVFTFVTAYIGLKGLCAMRPGINYPKLSIFVGMAYLSIGGIWASFDRFGWCPMGFVPEIVFLTVAHFHFAGFILLVIAGFVNDEVKSTISNIALIGTLIGIPMVAGGIIATQLRWGPAFEMLAAWWVAVCVMIVAILQIRIALQRGISLKPAICWGIAGAALLGGMLLAGLYCMRHIYALPDLDIPMMRALHGSANVLGFSFFGILGWWLRWNDLPNKIK